MSKKIIGGSVIITDKSDYYFGEVGEFIELSVSMVSHLSDCYVVRFKDGNKQRYREDQLSKYYPEGKPNFEVGDMVRLTNAPDWLSVYAGEKGQITVAVRLPSPHYELCLNRGRIFFVPEDWIEKVEEVQLELTMGEIADEFGIDVKNLRIKKENK